MNYRNQVQGTAKALQEEAALIASLLLTDDFI